MIQKKKSCHSKIDELYFEILFLIKKIKMEVDQYNLNIMIV